MSIFSSWVARLASFGLLVVTTSSCLSIGSQRSYQRYAALKPYDAIIVPGVPFRDGVWSDVMKMRVHWAVQLYKEGMTKHIIFSGSSVYTPYIEARIMALYAQALGVPRENLFTEEQAEHSTENLYYSYRLAKDKGFTKIALATDPFQGSFLRGFANKIKLSDVAFLPIVYKKMPLKNLKTPTIDPTWAYVDNFVPIVERESKAKRLQGTLGKHIQYEPEDDPNNKKLAE